MTKIRYFLMFALMFYSCKENIKDDEPIIMFEIQHDYVNENDFFDNYKYYSEKSDTIHFFASIDECGEWGGPEEYFKIYSNIENQKVLNYKKYKFNCDSIPYYYSDISILDYEKNKILTDNDKKLVSQLFLDLTKAKINEMHGSNAGSVFNLRNSDSTLNISILTDKTDFNKKYTNFKENLKLNKR